MQGFNKLIVFFISVVFFFACNEKENVVEVEAIELHNAMDTLTDVIVHDIFSPPVASRIYAYSSIAAYEVLAVQDSTYISLAGQLHGLTALPKATAEVNYGIAAIQAFLTVGKALIFSEESIEKYMSKWQKKLDDEGVSQTIKANSLAYGELAARHVLDWADKDNYKQTRTFEKYNVNSDPGRWQPTPPAYIEAIEPHWNEIRTFVLDSADQFIPPPATKFSPDKKDKFYSEMMEVYETGKNLSEEQSQIAAFWDCNPYVMNVHGHVMFATKKITPGGHWIGITKIVCKQSNADLTKSAQAYALTAVALADGFISCWDEKYRSNLIRPETVINKYLDEAWVPLLQTPPFPEYTSGHSVISTAASVALTSIFGDNFHFVDSTEVHYGLPVREFDSFYAASQEAAISRLYGGIHYRPAIDEGVKQGMKVGEWVVNHIRMNQASEDAGM